MRTQNITDTVCVERCCKTTSICTAVWAILALYNLQTADVDAAHVHVHGKKHICMYKYYLYIINPPRACVAKVTVVGYVCLSVCLLSHISPLECLFILKSMSRTQRAPNIKKFVGISLKPLHCGDPALPALYGYT